MGNPRWHEKARYLDRLNASWLLWDLAAIVLRGLTRNADFKEKAPDCIKRNGFSFILHLFIKSGQDATAMCKNQRKQLHFVNMNCSSEVEGEHTLWSKKQTISAFSAELSYLILPLHVSSSSLEEVWHFTQWSKMCLHAIMQNSHTTWYPVV